MNNSVYSIHTLHERLDAEQDITRGIEFGDTEMERKQPKKKLRVGTNHF